MTTHTPSPLSRDISAAAWVPTPPCMEALARLLRHLAAAVPDRTAADDGGRSDHPAPLTLLNGDGHSARTAGRRQA